MAAKKTKNSKKNKKTKKLPLWLIIVILLLASTYLILKYQGFFETHIDPVQEVVKFNENPQEYINNLLGIEQDDSQSSTESTKAPETQVSSFTTFTNTSIEVPKCPATISGKGEHDHEVHSYNGFQLCYRESYEEAEWVAYTMNRDKLKNAVKRKDNFRPDESISTGSSTLADYKATGYDRGHLAPSADLTYSFESMNDSFYMSNMTPQLPDFNRGRWKELEDQVRQWTDKFGEIAVITGPVLEKSADNYSSIGKNNVAVPEYFYKALLAKKDDGTMTAIGFIMPNKKCEYDIMHYAVSIDEVEQRTGLDFFSMLEDSAEDSLEASKYFEDWK